MTSYATVAHNNCQICVLSTPLFGKVVNSSFGSGKQVLPVNV